MKINFKVRLRQKQFIVGIISALLLFIQQIAKLLGFDIATDSIMQMVNTFLGLLIILGVVVDPTTKGIGDSEQALKYNVPKENKHGN